MTKKKAKGKKGDKKPKKKGKVKRGPPPDATDMGANFDGAMERIAKAPWPPK